jgi:hypothetical protein
MTTRPSRERGENEPSGNEMAWVRPVLTVLIVSIIGFLLMNPTVKVNVAHAFGEPNQNQMFDTTRQLKRIYLDSFMPIFEGLKSQVGCETTVEANQKLRIFVQDKTCDRSFNTIYTGNIALSEYFKMKNSPIKAISEGYGFETVILETEKGRIVTLPVDMLKSVVEAYQEHKAVSAPKAATIPKVVPAKPKPKPQVKIK